MNWTEFFCAIVALSQLGKLKGTYWKWFVWYVVFISVSELFGKWGLGYFPYLRKFYYDFFIIPVEFLFLYWLYALKSLGNRKLFQGSVAVYLLSFIPHLFYIGETREINSMSYTTGNLLLLVMVALEFYRQIQSDAILHFHRNKMFYINAGVLLLYLGTLPFFAFDRYLFERANSLWQDYFTFFQLANCIMYLLFTASFLWGKPNT